MPGSMPYLVDKGPYFSVIESLLSDPVTRARALVDLRGGVPIADLVGFDSTSLAGDGRTEADRKQHLNEDWFGFGGGHTFWLGYEGNPELILREGMTRAIEVSFDIEHGAAAPTADEAAGRRHWPIDLFWICQGPWFQCWVLWRAAEQGEGHVTLVITTPAARGLPLTAKITRPVDATQPPYTSPDYAHPPETRSPPARPSRAQGMWVIGHENYTRKLFMSTVRTRFGEIQIPELGWSAVDPTKVECVAPAEWEGGILDEPRRYEPPTP